MINKKNIMVTSLGRIVINAVRNSSIKTISDIEETTNWETNLENEPEAFENDIKTFVSRSVREAFKIEIPSDEKQILCPICKHPLRFGITKNDIKNWYCTGYKEGCKFTLWETTAGAKLTEKDVATLCEGKQTRIMHCISKAGKPFDCRFKLDEEKKIKFIFE